MKSTRKLHPIARLNLIPRIIACTFYVIIIGSISLDSLLSLPFISIAILGASWPHVALFLASQKVDSKRQEEINMHLDAVFCGLLVIAYPSFEYASTVGILLVSNGLFIGSFRLLATTLAAFLLAAAVTYLVLRPDYLIPASIATDVIIFLFFCSYFGCFAFLGNNLTRQLIKLNKEVKYLSMKDPLTQCYNRLYLDKKLIEEIQRCYRVGYPISIIFADIDHFKKINDDYGHNVGDAVLQQFVAISQECIREDSDWLARFGGEEFLIILSYADNKVAKMVAERIRVAISEHVFVAEEKTMNITCSFGVASIDPIAEHEDKDKVDANGLITLADQRLYRAKELGRDRVQSA